MRFGDRVSILITSPGRMSICLRCHCLGHLRADCPKGWAARQTRETTQTAPLQVQVEQDAVSETMETISPTYSIAPSEVDDLMTGIETAL